ncbi:hypothetical protein [Hanstruepera ponticola]|uniref:hypothetical protein n=1 Tax=Hanstruepera ponticola TaxID=2042995 RepID=UPI0013C453C1|nr:hypothetical protein [Hanstruepera ponticola]
MKYFKILTILLASSTLLLSSCKDKAETPEATTTTENSELQPLQVFDAQNQQKTTTAQNVSGVYHYTCSNGCAGGAAAAGNCSTCGNALAHNQAYHSNNNNTANTPATTPTNPAATPTPEPSQNSAGVWHYTCGNGCAGGAGSAGNCSSCGGTLAHNSAYH